MISKRQYVIGSFPKRLDLDWNHAQAVVKVLAEDLLLYQFL